MVDDQYKLKNKSDTELLEWISEYKTGTAEYNAGIQESIRRVAVIEELIEKTEDPVRKREWIAIGIAILALVVAIVAIVLFY